MEGKHCVIPELWFMMGAMTDPAATTQPPADQNPLDVLESLLAQAKQKGAAGAGTVAPPSNAVAGAPDDPSLAGLTTETSDPNAEPIVTQRTPEELAVLEAERQEQIAAQRAQMQAEIAQTPEYQARLQQEAEKKQTDANTAADDGFKINQVDHTKI